MLDYEVVLWMVILEGHFWAHISSDTGLCLVFDISYTFPDQFCGTVPKHTVIMD